jgi:hypothetical protein
MIELMDRRGFDDCRTGNAADISGSTVRGETSNSATTSSIIKESSSGVKGLAAAVHGTGEMIRGTLNAGVDRMFNDVRHLIILTFFTKLFFHVICGQIHIECAVTGAQAPDS